MLPYKSKINVKYTNQICEFLGLSADHKVFCHRNPKSTSSIQVKDVNSLACQQIVSYFDNLVPIHHLPPHFD